MYLEKNGFHFGANFWKATNLLILWPVLATSAKRLHDINISAWWLLLNLIPVVGSLIIFVLNCIMPGTKGENRFEPSIA